MLVTVLYSCYWVSYRVDCDHDVSDCTAAGWGVPQGGDDLLLPFQTVVDVVFNLLHRVLKKKTSHRHILHEKGGG